MSWALNNIWLVPLLPFTGFIILVIGGKRLSKALVSAIGPGSAGLSALVTIGATAGFSRLPAGQDFVNVPVWDWLRLTDALNVSCGFQIDALSLLMALVITIVGSVIHVYSCGYMAEDDGYQRFFAYMNLFVAAMLLLVLSDNLLLLYVGWEGVGLCSYLLIGFWYKEPSNNRAAIKAFVVTRIGDTAMILGIIYLFLNLGTLNIADLQAAAGNNWETPSREAILATILLLGGALGKSAQLPLQTWLPDAMAGPTPVSALIHAATMVTAGVYLIARMHGLFELAPPVQHAVAIIGALTLLMAGLSATVQTDIKRVLAYSTMSQIGYMFLALGLGAWPAAMFHFGTHACFKALLFLGAGCVILAMHHEQNMYKMADGLWKKMPITFFAFLVGGAALASLPFLTSGFYSKEGILTAAWNTDFVLWGAGVAGALITAFYTFRMIFLTFFSETKSNHHRDVEAKTPLTMWSSLVVLAGATVGLSFVRSWFAESASESESILPEVVASGASILGLFGAYLFFKANAFHEGRTSLWLRFVSGGFGFDLLYDAVFVRPFAALAFRNRNDAIDRGVHGIENLFVKIFTITSGLQTGKVRQYLIGIALGAIALVSAVVLL